MRGGGHHLAGTALVDGGLTIDLSPLRDVRVDPVARTVVAGGGCRLGDVDRATQGHGLATPLGFVSKVGLGGLTLGGGLGYLTRRFGWTVDNLLAVEIVTAAGEVLTASRDENADLFWGVRGAGANLGVVTRLTYRLHPVGPSVYGGLIAWPFEWSEKVLAAYRQITANAPRELAVWLNLLTAPPEPFVPPAWHGRKLCAMAVCHSGDAGAASAAADEIRAIGAPVLDLLGPMPYPAVQSYLDDTEPDGMHYYWRAEYLSALDATSLETLSEAVRRVPDAVRGGRRSAHRRARSTSSPRTTAPSATATLATWSGSRACGRRTTPTPILTGPGCGPPTSGSARTAPDGST